MKDKSPYKNISTNKSIPNIYPIIELAMTQKWLYMTDMPQQLTSIRVCEWKLTCLISGGAGTSGAKSSLSSGSLPTASSSSVKISSCSQSSPVTDVQVQIYSKKE